MQVWHAHGTARLDTLRHITKRNDTVRHMHITKQHGRYHITSSQRIARQREERKVRAKCCDFAGVSSNSEDLPGAHCGFDSLMKCFRKRAIKEKPSGPYQIILVRGLTILKTHLLSHSRAFLGWFSFAWICIYLSQAIFSSTHSSVLCCSPFLASIHATLNSVRNAVW